MSLCGVLQVTVHYPQGRQQLVSYRQAFTGPTSRHCCNCFRLVEGCALPQDSVLQGALDLFCSLDCERLFFIKNSSSECTADGPEAADRACSEQVRFEQVSAVHKELLPLAISPPAALQLTPVYWLIAVACALLLPPYAACCHCTPCSCFHLE
jgi:hypothetical protein